jgi:protease PrsW
MSHDPQYRAPGNGSSPYQPGPLNPRVDDFELLKEEFRHIRLDRLIPLAGWLQDQPWNLVWVRWFLAYALCPFVLLFMNPSVQTAAWGFGLYFAVTWLIVFSLCMKPEPVDKGLLAAVCIFTAVVGVTLVLFGQNLPLINLLYKGTESEFLPVQLVSYVLGVGLLEEAAKALPVFLFVYQKPGHGYRPLTFAFIGAVSGLAFGVKEAVHYTQQYEALLSQGVFDNLGQFIVVQFLRLISLPLLHACFSGIVGYFIGLAAAYKKAPRALILTGLGLAALLHGLYDTFSNGWLGLVIAAVTVLIFIAYVRTGDLITKALIAEEASHSQSQGDPGAVWE